MSDSVELIDLGRLPKLGLKGPAVIDWLAAQEIAVPDNVYELARLADGSSIVRLGANEFMLEGASEFDAVAQLAQMRPQLPSGVYHVPRQEATFLLQGPAARTVLAQTCAIDFRNAPADFVIFTRMAGVSCGIVPQREGDSVVYRIWIDPSYADYLWRTLAEIVAELGGTHERRAGKPLPASVLT